CGHRFDQFAGAVAGVFPNNNFFANGRILSTAYGIRMRGNGNVVTATSCESVTNTNFEIGRGVAGDANNNVFVGPWAENVGAVGIGWRVNANAKGTKIFGPVPSTGALA